MARVIDSVKERRAFSVLYYQSDEPIDPVHNGDGLVWEGKCERKVGGQRRRDFGWRRRLIFERCTTLHNLLVRTLHNLHNLIVALDNTHLFSTDVLPGKVVRSLGYIQKIRLLFLSYAISRLGVILQGCWLRLRELFTTLADNTLYSL